MDPHVLKDDRNSPNLSIDNPLSQNPGKLLFHSLLTASNLIDCFV